MPSPCWKVVWDSLDNSMRRSGRPMVRLTQPTSHGQSRATLGIIVANHNPLGRSGANH